MAYQFTPARQAALRKAQQASARNRRRNGIRNNRRIYGQTKNRPQGVAGLKRNTIPYARANKRSQTVGFNAGTIIPGTKKRIVFGGYARLESTVRKTAVDRAVNKAVYKYAKPTTARGKAVTYLKKNVKASPPGLRVNVGGAETRLGTSRGAGPTVIIRKGTHKAPKNKTVTGVRKYDEASRKRKKGGRKRKERRNSSRKSSS